MDGEVGEVGEVVILVVKQKSGPPRVACNVHATVLIANEDGLIFLDTTAESLTGHAAKSMSKSEDAPF